MEYLGIYSLAATIFLWSFCCDNVLAKQSCNDTLWILSRTLSISLDTELQTISSPPIDSAPLSQTWKIHAKNNKLIGVDFSYFNIKYTENCSGGFLEIYNGNSTSSELFLDRKLCGNDAYRNFLSTTSDLIFVYCNDAKDPTEGFNVTLSTDASCPISSFRCWDGDCIAQSKQCDGIRNCFDDSDEIECEQKSTSFDQCGKQNFAPDFTFESRPGSQSRIVGGEEAVPASWPWQVLVLPDNMLCGGTIINEEWVLTAAHCVARIASNLITVRAGVYDRTSSTNPHIQTSTVTSSIVHPDYIFKKPQLGYDVAVLKLDTKLIYTEYVRPICLLSNVAELPSDGTTCFATGWGKTGANQPISSTLRQVRLELRGRDFCNKFYIEDSKRLLMPESVICAGAWPSNNADTCNGDSGGPLVCLKKEKTWYQVGITSYGYEICGSRPGYYASVGELYPWIDYTTGVDLNVGTNPNSSYCLISAWHLTFLGLVVSLCRAEVF